MITYYYVCNQLLPILVEKTVKLSGLWREIQCILSTQSEIGLFPAGEGSLYCITALSLARRRRRPRPPPTKHTPKMFKTLAVALLAGVANAAGRYDAMPGKVVIGPAIDFTVE